MFPLPLAVPAEETERLASAHRPSSLRSSIVEGVHRLSTKRRRRKASKSGASTPHIQDIFQAPVHEDVTSATEVPEEFIADDGLDSATNEAISLAARSPQHHSLGSHAEPSNSRPRPAQPSLSMGVDVFQDERSGTGNEINQRRFLTTTTFTDTNLPEFSAQLLNLMNNFIINDDNAEQVHSQRISAMRQRRSATSASSYYPEDEQNFEQRISALNRQLAEARRPISAEDLFGLGLSTNERYSSGRNPFVELEDDTDANVGFETPTRASRHLTAQMMEEPIFRDGPNQVVIVMELNQESLPAPPRHMSAVPLAATPPRPSPGASSRAELPSPRTPMPILNLHTPGSLQTSGRGSVQLLEVQHAEEVSVDDDSLASWYTGDNLSYLSSAIMPVDESSQPSTPLQQQEDDLTMQHGAAALPAPASIPPAHAVAALASATSDPPAVTPSSAATPSPAAAPPSAATALAPSAVVPAPITPTPAGPEYSLFPRSTRPDHIHATPLNPAFGLSASPEPTPGLPSREILDLMAGPYADPRASFGRFCTEEVDAALEALNSMRMVRAPTAPALVLCPIVCRFADEYRSVLWDFELYEALRTRPREEETLERSSLGIANSWLREMNFREANGLTSLAASPSASSPASASAPNSTRSSPSPRIMNRFVSPRVRALSAASAAAAAALQREAEIAEAIRVDPIAAMSEANRKAWLAEVGPFTWARVVVTETGLETPEVMAAWVAGLEGAWSNFRVQEIALKSLADPKCRCVGMVQSHRGGRWGIVFLGM